MRIALRAMPAIRKSVGWPGCLLAVWLCLDAPHAAVLTRVNDRVPGLDPAHSAAVSSARVVGLLYERLLNYAPETEPYGLEPGLAVEMPRLSANGLAYTFRLRRDARFAADACFGTDSGGKARGRAVLADDVIYSLKRLADPRLASPGAWTLAGRIAGLESFRDRCRGDVDIQDLDVEGLVRMDERTVRLVLKSPSPRFEWILAMPYTSVVPREAVRYYGDDFSRKAVGSGPYRLASWRPNYRMRLARRPEWPGWRKVLERYPGEPFESLVFLVIDDPVTEWLAFLTGMLDVQGGVSRDNLDAVLDASGNLPVELVERGIRMRSREALDVAYIGFNFRNPVLGTNRALRAAMHCAFDARSWENFHRHRVRTATGPVPPGIAGRMPDSENPWKFDLSKARKRMREAGYPGGIDPRTGKRLVLNLEIGRTDSETRESTELLASFMERIGIVLQPNYSNWPAFLARVSRGEAQLFRLMWLADYPDAENFLQLFYGPNTSPGPNRVNYENPEYDRIFEKAQKEIGLGRRLDLYREMQKILQRDVPWLWMHHRVNTSLYHDRVGGFVPHDFPYGMEIYYRFRNGKGRGRE